MHSARDQARDMSHVDEKVSSDGVRDLPHARKVDRASRTPTLLR